MFYDDSIRVILRHLFYEYRYSPHKLAFQNIMREGDQKLMIDLEWPKHVHSVATIVYPMYREKRYHTAPTAAFSSFRMNARGGRIWETARLPIPL